jgi:hypothetical protein
MSKILLSLKENTDLIPIKKELDYMAQEVRTKNFDTIFNSYGEDDKYFTEMFYMQLAQQSNNR